MGADKGFGFVKGEDGDECFFHFRALADESLREKDLKGYVVSFSKQWNDKKGKWAAQNIQVESEKSEKPASEESWKKDWNQDSAKSGDGGYDGSSKESGGKQEWGDMKQQGGGIASLNWGN